MRIHSATDDGCACGQRPSARQRILDTGAPDDTEAAAILRAVRSIGNRVDVTDAIVYRAQSTAIRRDIPDAKIRVGEEPVLGPFGMHACPQLGGVDGDRSADERGRQIERRRNVPIDQIIGARPDAECRPPWTPAQRVEAGRLEIADDRIALDGDMPALVGDIVGDRGGLWWRQTISTRTTVEGWNGQALRAQHDGDRERDDRDDGTIGHLRLTLGRVTFSNTD